MSTHANISVQQPKGHYLTIYCHHDGYIEHVGRLLSSTYNTHDKAMELINLGDVSCIYDSIDQCGAYHPSGEDWEDVKPQTREALTDGFPAQGDEPYDYAFKGGEWFVLTSQGWKHLSLLIGLSTLNGEQYKAVMSLYKSELIKGDFDPRKHTLVLAEK